MELHCKNFGHLDLVVVGGGCTGLIAAVRQEKPVWEVGGKNVEALL